MNQFTKITLYYISDYDTENHQYILNPRLKPIVFHSKEELIKWLADRTITNDYTDSSRWINEYFTNQNLTGTDCESIWNQAYTYDSENDIAHYGEKYSTKYLHSLVFIDDNDRVIDVRQFKEEVYAYLYAKQANLLYIEQLHWLWRRNYNRHNRHTSHTVNRFRHVKHQTAALKNAYDVIDEYNGESYISKCKPKDKELAFCWWDDFPSRRSAGWKNNKRYKKQWMHKLHKKVKFHLVRSDSAT